jgi:hypothetical protein
MKKVLAVGFLAIACIALSQQEASAWINSRFGVGLNWDFQSGGNRFGWGLWRNGQPPGPEYFGQGGGHGYGPGFQNFGAPMPHMHHGHHHGAIDMPATEPAYAAPSYNYPPPYQFATYPRPVYYYPAPYYGR